MINRLYFAMIEYYKNDAERIQHFCKVHSYSKLIAETEGIDSNTQFILEAAALTHDIGIKICEEKYGSYEGKLQEEEGPPIAEKMLGEIGFSDSVSKRVQYLIAHHHTYSNIDGMDYQILVEADFLVNIHELKTPFDEIKNIYKNIFVTKTGKKMCRDMFGVTD